MMQKRGYEQVGHLYDPFDRKDRGDFFHHYAAEVAGILDK